MDYWDTNVQKILHHIDIVNDLIIHKTRAQSAECATLTIGIIAME